MALKTTLITVLTVLSSSVCPVRSWVPGDDQTTPSTPYSPSWQKYFEVTEPLPNITWDFGHSFAGNLPVNRPGHPNNTLFFFAVERENGSLTADGGARGQEPWGIWLNGGPGSSSMLGFAFENGPIRLSPEAARAAPNNDSWNNLLDYIWIDQPVGVGWATADEDGLVQDEDELGRDFMGFLANLVEVFPSLKTRPLYLTGESYAGTYIPYIMKTYFGMPNPPVNIVAFGFGNGVIGNEAAYFEVPTVTILETYPQLIGYDPDLFEYYREQSHSCGYDLNLTYPQNGPLPSVDLVFSTSSTQSAPKRSSIREKLTQRRLLSRALRRAGDKFSIVNSKRSLDSVECDLIGGVLDNAFENLPPWTGPGAFFTYYDVPDGLAVESSLDPYDWWNDPQTRAAIHAPVGKEWLSAIDDVFATPNGADPSPEPMVFFSELAANATAKGVRVILYSGNDDALVTHRGTEVAIQNTTFGGIQGFSRKPSTAWYDDEGEFAGIVHQERNWTYVLVHGAGHLIPYNSPSRGYVLLRDFILGQSDLGLVVTSSNGTVSVIGGEDPRLAGDALAGQRGMYVGTGFGDNATTTGTFFWPSATVAAWESFLATATATSTPATTV